jgi:hypothetical protein
MGNSNTVNKNNKNNIDKTDTTDKTDNDFGVSSMDVKDDIKDDIIEHIKNNIYYVSKEEYEQIKKATLENGDIFYENISVFEAKNQILLYGKTKKRIDIFKIK